MPPGEAAGELAAAGVPVFPCQPGGKAPITRHGFKDATADRAVVARWWGRVPDANIGMPTGAASGWDVVDVDVRDDGSGYGRLADAARAGLTGGWILRVGTPSGGSHLYYPADPARPQRSWAAGRAHVDFRGDGGYVVVPPSVVETGRGDGVYRLLDRNTPPASPVDARKLREMLSAAPAPRTDRRRAADSERVEAGLRAARLAGWLARRQPGERNASLFWAACRMAEEGCDQAATVAVLGPAARHVGLDDREIGATVRSAHRAAGSAGAGHLPPAAVVAAGQRPVVGVGR
jgi:hypothetical protein